MGPDPDPGRCGDPSPPVAAAAVLLAAGDRRRSTSTSHSQGISAPPHSEPVVRTGELIQAAFPGQANPAMVAVKTDTDSPTFKHAVAQLQAQGARDRPGARASGSNRTTRTRWRGSRSRSSATESTRHRPGRCSTLRNQLLPATIGTLPGVSYAVTGDTAAAHDNNQQMRDSLPIVFAFVLTLRVPADARLVPLDRDRAICWSVNLLSVAAAYGVMVAVFQYGWGERLLDFKANGGDHPLAADVHVRDPVRPLDGLSGVHPQPHPRGTRPRPEHRGGRRARDQDHRRHRHQRGVVMVGVFSIFATLPIIDMKEMGIGLAAAV